MKQLAYFTALLTALLLAACQSDPLVESTPVSKGVTQLKFTPVGMGQTIVETRSTAKDPDETQIHNLHVFFFNHATGEYLQPSGSGTAEEGKSYRCLEGGENTLLIDGDQFADASSVDIYIMANVAEGTFTEDGDGHCEQIANRAALDAYMYRPYNEDNRNLIGRMPATGLPMVGMITGQNFNVTNGQVIEVQLKSLMARVDFNFTLDIPTQDIENGYPILQIDGIRLVSAAAGASFTVPAGVTAADTLSPDLTEVSITLRPGTANNSYSFTFYTFEHKRNATGQIDASVTDEYRQRYKPTIAAGDAVYLYLTGRYFDKNANLYDVSYTLYLGENPEDDFNVLRNCKYVNNVSVRGLTAINHPDFNPGEHPDQVYGLDTRVNMSRETNDYYYTILRERNHDAHFCVTPVDVYLSKRGSINFSIPADAQSWIWMAPIGREATFEGDGKEDYFYTDMQAYLAEKYGTQVSSYTMTNTTDQLKVERIYLYIDENASLSSRETNINITYTPEGGAATSRTLTIGQQGVLTALVDDAGNPVRVYMEYYEEYLNYFDPLAAYNSEQVYEGLPWGNNSEIGSSRGSILGVAQGTMCSQNVTEGDVFTPMIANANGQAMMRLNDKAVCAASYALNKNKRNRNGEVSEVIWYLPGIRELEQTLRDNYTLSEDFQDKWYWSSAAGEEEGFTVSWYRDTYNEDLNRARATRVRFYPGGASNPNAPGNVSWGGSNMEYTYDKSGIDEPGWQPRSNMNRVRVFRIADGIR